MAKKVEHPDEIGEEEKVYAHYFLGVTVLLIILGIWALWREVVGLRPWKTYQKQYYSIERAALEKELQEVQTELKKPQTQAKYAELKRLLEEAKQKFNSPEVQAEYNKLGNDLKKIEAELSKIKNKALIARSKLQEQEYLYQKYQMGKRASPDSRDPVSREGQEGEGARGQEGKSRFSGSRFAGRARGMEELKKEVAALESQENEMQKKRNALLENRGKLTADIDRYSLELDSFPPIAQKAEIERLLESAQKPQIKIQQTYIEEMNKADRCQSCHVGIDQPVSSPTTEAVFRSSTNKQPFAKHPGDFIYLKNHPTDGFGCTICHHGQGRAISSTEKAHGNVEFWTQPMLKGELAQATCQKCHSDVKRLRGAPMLSKGEELIEKYDCYGCHKIAGYENMPKTGPPLSDIGKKISYSWFSKWLDEPRNILPEARMPDYDFSAEESEAVADYLFSLSVDEKSDVPAEEIDSELADKGKIIYNEARCSICHVANERGGAFKKVYASDLSTVGSKLNKNWLIDWIKNPQAYYPDTKMPQYRFTDEQSAALIAYIKNEFVDWDLEDTKLKEPQSIEMASIEKGAQLIKNYGCFGCHDIKGVEELEKIGPYLRRSEMEENVAAELSSIGSKPMEMLDFGKLEGELEKTREAFLSTKLKTPRVFRDNLMMPTYKFPDDEIIPLVTLSMGFTPEEIENMPIRFRVLSKPSDYETTGEFAQIADELKCLVCHTIKGKGSDFGPDLTIEGSKVKREWLNEFLERPDIIRPLQQQMPKFQISPQPRMIRGQLSPSEVETILTYIVTTLTTTEIPEGFLYGQTVASDEITSGRKLYYQKACNVCHQMGNEGGGVGPELTKAGGRLKPGYIFMYLKNPKSLIPDIIMPNYNISDEEATLLVKFLMNLK